MGYWAIRSFVRSFDCSLAPLTHSPISYSFTSITSLLSLAMQRFRQLRRFRTQRASSWRYFSLRLFDRSFGGIIDYDIERRTDKLTDATDEVTNQNDDEMTFGHSLDRNRERS